MARTRVRKSRSEEVIPDTFGGRLKMWRDTRSLRQSDLANYLGIDRTTIARYELGRSLPANLRIFMLALRHYDCLRDALENPMGLEHVSPFGREDHSHTVPRVVR